MLYSKLSRKGQVSVPKAVREALGATYGDVIAYQIRDGTVTLHRVDPLDRAFHAALANTLDEWATPEDEAAFRDL